MKDANIRGSILLEEFFFSAHKKPEPPCIKGMGANYTLLASSSPPHAGSGFGEFQGVTSTTSRYSMSRQIRNRLITDILGISIGSVLGGLTIYLCI